jgi:hypothetical protein
MRFGHIWAFIPCVGGAQLEIVSVCSAAKLAVLIRAAVSAPPMILTNCILSSQFACRNFK